MSESYVVVSVECASAALVREAVERHVGAAILGGEAYALGLSVEISDNRNALEYAQQFLHERGIEDQNPIWSELDARSFPVDVDVHALDGTIGAALKESVGDHLARALSRDMRVRTVLSIESGYVPFGIYENGARVRDFAERYVGHFASSDWIPRSIVRLLPTDPE